MKYAVPLCVDISNTVAEMIQNAPKRDQALALFVAGKSLALMWIHFMRTIDADPDTAFGMLEEMWENMDAADEYEAWEGTLQ